MSSFIVIGANGNVGRLFAAKLSSGDRRVIGVDLQASPTLDGTGIESLTGDICSPDPALAKALRRADVVLLALPEKTVLTAIPIVATIMQAGALLVDTTSVKARVCSAMALHAKHLETLSLNPLFAPSINMSNRPIIVVNPCNHGPKCEQLCHLLESWNARLVHMTASRHDQLTAGLQLLTHMCVLAFGTALLELELSLDELRSLAPPPHLLMLALLSRMVSGEAELYWEIQGNPVGHKPRSALVRAVDRLAAAAAGNQQSEFSTLFDQVRLFLDGHSDELRSICAQALDVLPA
jgi:prephenate dehydrogenase